MSPRYWWDPTALGPVGKRRARTSILARQLRRVGELRQAQPRVLWLARGHKVDLGARPLVQPRPYDAPG